MRREIESPRHFAINERPVADGRVVISAWLLALTFAVLFATGDALASRHLDRPRQCKLAGAVIPGHDPAVAGADEIAASDWLERVRAEAYSGF